MDAFGILDYPGYWTDMFIRAIVSCVTVGLPVALAILVAAHIIKKK
ncbi:MAG: hypothetical protein JSW52_08030 [Candidatus Coatesbacteria bacterium]|nr:MAG: hypothetical protein JSW52_08030 [Candidatus Coatesbacteria bacterium]